MTDPGALSRIRATAVTSSRVAMATSVAGLVDDTLGLAVVPRDVPLVHHLELGMVVGVVVDVGLAIEEVTEHVLTVHQAREQVPGFPFTLSSVHSVEAVVEAERGGVLVDGVLAHQLGAQSVHDTIADASVPRYSVGRFHGWRLGRVLHRLRHRPLRVLLTLGVRQVVARRVVAGGEGERGKEDGEVAGEEADKADPETQSQVE